MCELRPESRSTAESVTVFGQLEVLSGKSRLKSKPERRIGPRESGLNSAKRPLSPHVQVYRLQLTSVLSFTHRLTGIALAAGTIWLVVWLAAAATGPESFAAAQSFAGSFLGRLLLFGWTLALFYHLCNGIRHLFWDIGLGFELDEVYRSGWTVVVAAVLLTLVTWIVGYIVM